MKRLSILLAGAALCSFPAASALADCRAELANLTSDSATTASISSGNEASTSANSTGSDTSAATGTTTNFETGETSGQSASAQRDSGGKIIQDGTHAPLESAANETKSDSKAATGMKSGTTGAKADGNAAASTDTTKMASGNGSDSDKLVQDGQTMPMASSPGGGDDTRAMSNQDVDAQQDGEQTAAAASGQGDGDQQAASNGSKMASASGSSSGDYQQAVQRAQDALAAGDETACMSAVKEARGMQDSMGSSN